MSRTTHATSRIDRRTLLLAGGTAVAASAAGWGAGTGPRSATAAPPAGVHTASRRLPGGTNRPVGTGTTLEAASAFPGGTGYRRMRPGPAWPAVVRTDLADAGGGRDARRTPLGCFVQFTDLHVVDVQSPLRYEYLRGQTASAWRPQEALSVAGAVALVERVNALRGGPNTGLPVSFVMTTGDNTDNNSSIELDWFLAVMSGGRITPNSGDPRSYEGVQDSGLELYWHPGSGLRDADKRAGFPRIDGFLDAALRTVHSPGLSVPWYSTVGNHDRLPGGCYAAGDPVLAGFVTGSRKLESLPGPEGAALWKAVRKGRDPQGEIFKDVLRRYAGRMRTVTPDERRAPYTPKEYVARHLQERWAGKGPAGHGYTAANLETGRMYYTFAVAEGVVGVSLDTTDAGGHYEGSLGTAQLRWLERTLERHADASVIVFSHHTSTTMRNLHPDPARPGETRHGGDEVVALLHEHPCVAAWINGHSHRNRITPHRHPDAARSFWEISTASHIDDPQLARVVELADNHDGTLSLFATLIESAAPYRTDFGDLSQTGLAALYRELAHNAPGARPGKAGEPGDRNTELLLKKP
ncbi:TIGR03767 family metallophosphoesterase [Streptomyces sp. NPDC059506]|uniref:TIGR03767 family metallophosphoesterase n=1 Tax=Streptomyces sp. NPDC059506 TaxID=3347751 RepID=UPI003693E79A